MTKKARPSARAAAVGVLLGGGLFLLGGLDVLFGAGLDKTTTSIMVGLLATPSRLWLSFAGFVAAFLLLHAVFAVAVFELPRHVLSRFTADPRRLRVRQLLVAVTAVLCVLLLNARFYPESTYGQGLSPVMESGALSLLIAILAAAVSGIAVAGAAIRIHQVAKGDPAKLPLRAGVSSLVVAIGAAVALASGGPGFADRSTFPDRPHVLLVGIDGWRLDTAPLTGGEPGLMPFMDSLFSEAAVIAETYTPQGRTFPAWMSILTGREPPDHGARFNLIAEEHVDLGFTLVDALGELGYHSIFAMDERRFANIGTHHGFDRAVGPPMGAADFLLGRWGDTPLTNLAINTPLGRVLFPYSHGNRGVAGTYRPATFDRAVSRALRTAPDQPLFLAVHYQLPHWPYVWGERAARSFPDDSIRGPGGYFATLARVDEQVKELFDTLRAEGILDHALIAVFSDHGESFGSPVVGWRNVHSGQLRAERPGHGTDVLSLSQYQVPLAFLRTGLSSSLTPGVRPIRGSLTDIFPTVADWVGFPVPEAVTGMSLVGELDSPGRGSWDRPLTLETGFTLPSLLGSALDERRLLDEGAVYYDVQPNGRLTLKEERVADLLEDKQRAVLYGSWILAAIPESAGGEASRLLMANLESREYIDLMDGGLPGGPIGKLLDHVCRRFRGELGVRIPQSLKTWRDEVQADVQC